MLQAKKTASAPSSLAVATLFALLAPLACQSPNLDETSSAKPNGARASAIQLENAFPNITFSQPVEMTHAGDRSNRVYVVEKGGRIRVLENSPATQSASLYLDIQNRVATAGEMGLLGLAFHPNFKQNGYFFVNYVKENPRETIISRFKASSTTANQVDPATEVVLLRIPQPAFDNHKGGKIAFGRDGFLYIATGDGGGGGDPLNNAQNRTNLLGKILRIDVNGNNKGTYGIPADNPYVGNSNGFREEIYAYGLRNPWRFSFDFITGQLWLADVGQGKFEEIDIITKGGNYGWRLKEGNSCYNPETNCDQPGLVAPIFQYGRTEGVSITGGTVYWGRRQATSLKGKYIYGDFGSGKIWALTFSGNKVISNEVIVDDAGSISAFGEDANRELYILDFGTGTIKRMAVQ
ncbi:PQQ-dependent sugar dehydrogenase [Tellurirhabdus bombi]|uniref:PQQ-dependent sugar dehydrogenase n=1 Tax=Tellurirhabdus bombi TaxID=2907205 RepID=UPI001F3EF7A0|nr:PQQ-dependent sugar dehydrogenase [Tellurirhabdus bombi]